MMIEWFTVVFGEPKEQAKLFTIVISTVFALIILLLNQGFINRRAKNERTILKIEELTTAVHNIMSMGKAINEAKREGHEYADSEDKLHEYCVDINKLCSLYFHKTPIRTNITDDILYIRAKEINGFKVSPLGSGFNADDFYAMKYLLDGWFYHAETILKQLRKKHIK